MRGLSSEFVSALKDGVLEGFLLAVHNDHKLCLEIRENYINIYYHGGNLCKISEAYPRGKKSPVYRAFFDKKYALSDTDKKLIEDLNANREDYTKWVGNIPALKSIMDTWMGKHPKLERGYQQEMVRHNNQDGKDYYILDIEYANTENNSRFDALAVKRPVSSGITPLTVLEIKYGDKAIGGNSGVVKHIRDMNAFLKDTAKFKDIREDALTILRQKIELGLLPSQAGNITCISDKAPEFILLVANHNPKSKALKNALNEADKACEALSLICDIRIVTQSGTEYGLSSKNAITIDAFLEKVTV